MAKVYSHVGGKKLTKIVALHADVQAELETVAKERAARSAAILEEHRKTGASRVYATNEGTKIDWYVVLEDERGHGAAMTIEYGRNDVKDSENDPGPSRPTWVLHDGCGLEHG